MKKIIIIMLVTLLCSCSAPERVEKVKTERQRESRTIAMEEITIAEAYTDIIDTGKNRINNILLACQKISGMELSPGEKFSFNKITGRKTSANGYKIAPVIIDGKKSSGLGGGVCQVSTTIYMAAVLGEFKITEHHNHSESVAYAPEGMDATVVYGVKDFSFINNTDNMIYIYVWVENNKVFVKIIEKLYVLS